MLYGNNAVKCMSLKMHQAKVQKMLSCMWIIVVL